MGRMSESDIEKLKRASTSGGTGKRGAQKISFTKEQFKKLLLTYTAIISAVIVSLCALGNVAYNRIQENAVINNASQDVYLSIIAKETQRTDNNKYHFYHYDNIYKKLLEKYDRDTGLFLFYNAVGESRHQLDRMVNEGIGGYNDFDEYLKANGFSSFDDWESQARALVLLTNDRDKLQVEINDMIGESSVTAEIGGGQK